MIYSNDASFSVYYNFHFPSSVEFALSDIYTPQTKCASKPTESELTVDVCVADYIYNFTSNDIYTPPCSKSRENTTEETITIDAELITDAFDICFVDSIPDQLETELIDYDANDTTLEDFYNWCFNDKLNIADALQLPNEFSFPDEEIDWTPLLHMQQELLKLSEWARSA